MTKVGINGVIVVTIALFIVLVVGFVMMFGVYRPMEPELLDIDFVDNVLGDNPVKGADPVNGNKISIDTGNNISQLSAQPNDGYVFAYWQVNSSANTNLKLCTDEVIRVADTRTGEFTPIFIAESNVINITTLEDATLKSHITNNTTAGKIYNLTQDCVLGSSFTALGTFKGVLKGNGHKVMGVNINDTATGTGMGIFAQLDGAVISELIIASGSITTVKDNVGSIAGVMNNSLISRCVSNISVANTNESGVAGGLAGINSSTKSTIYCSEFGGTISAKTANGIVGVDNNVILYKNKYNGAVRPMSTQIEWSYAEIKSGDYVRSAIWGSNTVVDSEYCSNVSVKSITFGSYDDYSSVVSGVSTASVDSNTLINNPNLASSIPPGPGAPFDSEYDGGLTYVDISANNDGSVGVYRVANGSKYDVYILTTKSNTRIKFNTDCDRMFCFTDMLQSINFNDLVDTSAVTSMSYMFYAINNITTLDLSGFDTSNVTSMRRMFSVCGNLTTIYVGTNWSTAKVTDSTSMFSGCIRLTGGNGTAFEPDCDSLTYARVDSVGAPGLLTLKN